MLDSETVQISNLGSKISSNTPAWNCDDSSFSNNNILSSFDNRAVFRQINESLLNLGMELVNRCSSMEIRSESVLKNKLFYPFMKEISDITRNKSVIMKLRSDLMNLSSNQWKDDQKSRLEISSEADTRIIIDRIKAGLRVEINEIESREEIIFNILHRLFETIQSIHNKEQIIHLQHKEYIHIRDQEADSIKNVLEDKEKCYSILQNEINIERKKNHEIKMQIDLLENNKRKLQQKLTNCKTQIGDMKTIISELEIRNEKIPELEEELRLTRIEAHKKSFPSAAQKQISQNLQEAVNSLKEKLSQNEVNLAASRRQNLNVQRAFSSSKLKDPNKDIEITKKRNQELINLRTEYETERKISLSRQNQLLTIEKKLTESRKAEGNLKAKLNNTRLELLAVKRVFQAYKQGIRPIYEVNDSF